MQRKTRATLAAAIGAAAVCLGVACAGNGNAQTASSADTLPVYEVVRQGVTAEQAKKLADALKLPATSLVVTNGAISYVDADRFLEIPGLAVGDAALERRLLAARKKDEPEADMALRRIDFDALRKISALDPDKALQSTADLFTTAAVPLQTGKPEVGHTVLSAAYKNAKGVEETIDQRLDTHVAYHFSDKYGHPIVGPGATVALAYDAQGKVTQFQYAVRELKEGPRVKVLSESEARARIAQRLPKGTDVQLRLVYWSPAFESESATRAPNVILPYYAYTTTREIKDARGETTRARSREQRIPATDDPRYVPSARLQVRGADSAEVQASVQVSGGRTPYRYTWLGSNPSVATAVEASVRYTPMVRVAPVEGAADERVRANEIVGVQVIDANGVVAWASETIAVQATPFPHERDGDEHGHGHGGATYGCESPAEPDRFVQERVGWQQGMAHPGGGSEKFCWLGNSSWPGDYIKPKKAGSLPSKPWINGDADYSNWGVNTANIVFINGDAWPDGFTAMFPGAPASDYNNNVFLLRPGNPSGTVQIESNKYNINYDHSWGPSGSNDRLYWLLGLLCEALDKVDSSNLSLGNRWGPAFGGLHIFTGFASNAADSQGAFGKAFAEDILGVNNKPLTIVKAWFAASTATSEGTAAAMGPIGPGGVTDKDDFYIGKGSKGPTILPADIKGWWYLHQ